MPGEGLVQSIDENEQGVGGPLLTCPPVGRWSGEEAAHVVGVQFGSDSSERVHERGAAVAYQRAFDSGQPVDDGM
jgi:hypothetical protein